MNMFSLLHDFTPSATLFTFGPVTIYWYGLFMAVAIAAAMYSALQLAPKYHLGQETIFDLSFWLVIGGLTGARLYEIILMWPYYSRHPWQTVKIWEGGLAIHGAIIAGLLIVWVFSYRHKINISRLTALLVPGLALGQAIGRWGNYFNQELFGSPTNLPWGIPINPINRPTEFSAHIHFHPTFLYESLGCLIISTALFLMNIRAAKNRSLGRRFQLLSVAFYVISYSLLRFTLEFIRLDETPVIWGWRWPQIASLVLIAVTIIILFFSFRKNASNCETND